MGTHSLDYLISETFQNMWTTVSTMNANLITANPSELQTSKPADWCFLSYQDFGL
jgi:hypothetical protein